MVLLTLGRLYISTLLKSILAIGLGVCQFQAEYFQMPDLGLKYLCPVKHWLAMFQMEISSSEWVPEYKCYETGSQLAYDMKKKYIEKGFS